jgi:hypothetical protein
MKFYGRTFVIAGLMGCALAISSGPAAATPLSAGSHHAGDQIDATALIDLAQHRGGGHRGMRGGGRHGGWGADIAATAAGAAGIAGTGAVTAAIAAIGAATATAAGGAAGSPIGSAIPKGFAAGTSQ